MAKFAFAFSVTSILKPPLINVAQAGLVALTNGNVVVQSIGQPWALTAERLESGEIAVSGGNGFSTFKYSIDNGASWIEDVSPSTIFHQGQVLFQAIGSTESAGGLNGASIGILPDGDLVVYKLPPVWNLTATRTDGYDIEVSGGPIGSPFRYSIDDGGSWIEATSPTTITQSGAVLFEAIGSELETQRSWLMQTEFLSGILQSTDNVIQPGVATRVDVNGVVGSPGTRTNLATYSQEFDNAGWAKSGGSTVSANTAIAPNGTLTADTWSRATTGSNFMSRSVVKSATPQTLTFSIFVKKGSASYFAMRMQGLYPARSDVTFDLDTGLVSRGPTVNTFTNVSASITPLADGWYRCTLTSTTDSATTAGFLVSFATSNVPVDGTSASAVADGYLWGAQLEEAAEASNYIPTTTAPVTNTLPRFDYDAGILRGLLVEPARINRCTNFNANPTDLTGVSKAGDAAATLTVVDDTAALTAAGLIGLCATGKVYKLDNSAGTTAAILEFSGGSGGVFKSTSSAYLRGSGSGIVRMYTVGAASLPLAAEYQRFALTGTPSANQTMVVAISAGSVVYCILNQLEIGAGASSVIPISGAAVTRPADVLNLTGLTKANGTYTARCWHEDSTYTDVAGVAVTNGGATISGVSVKPVQTISFF